MNRSERISLILAVPVTKAEFHSRMASGTWDLMRGRSPDLYAPVLPVGAALAACARPPLITVYRSAGLRDLRQAATTSSVLIIVAHWRGYVVRASDFGPGWAERIKCATRERGTPMAAVLEESGDISRERMRDDNTTLLNRIVRGMNCLIRGDGLRSFLPGGIGSTISTHPLILQTLSRDLLDDEFGATLQRGNQLELTDGLHPPGTIDEALGDFCGDIDLSCCTSSVAGTLLKMTRGNEVRVLMGDQDVRPVAHMRLLEYTLQMTIGSSIRYSDVRQSLSAGIRNACKEMSIRRRNA